MNTPTPSLQVQNVTRRFGDRKVLDDLSFSARPGDRVGLIGANGSGKTTLLRCIAGTLLYESGRIEVEGFETGSLEARGRIGVSFSQERSFHLRLTGHENLFFFARMKGWSSDFCSQKISEVSDELELGRITPYRVGQYSTGMIQQLSLARALLGDPRLVLLDEPTRSLDEEARERLWQALGARRNSVVLIATHLTSDIERCTELLEFSP